MSKDDKKTVAYSPTSSDFEHLHHCIRTGIITLGIALAPEKPGVFNLVRTSLNERPVKVDYFLKDFKLPATPSNRAEFTEKEVYLKMFSIYKEFYMRNNNIQEDVISEVKILDALKAEPKPKKEPKKKKVEKDWINFPLKQVDLFELIEICEKETMLG